VSGPNSTQWDLAYIDTDPALASLVVQRYAQLKVASRNAADAAQTQQALASLQRQLAQREQQVVALSQQADRESALSLTHKASQATQARLQLASEGVRALQNKIDTINANRAFLRPPTAVLSPPVVTIASQPIPRFLYGMFGLLIGLLAGAVCYAAVCLKPALKYDDSLDAFGVHGVGGFLGAVLTGAFASAALYKAGSGSDLPAATLGGAEVPRVLVQFLAAGVAAVFSFTLTLVLVKGIDLAFGFCVDADAEREGLDRCEHGEAGFDFGLAMEAAPETPAVEPRPAAVPPASPASRPASFSSRTSEAWTCGESSPCESKRRMPARSAVLNSAAASPPIRLNSFRSMMPRKRSSRMLFLSCSNLLVRPLRSAAAAAAPWSVAPSASRLPKCEADDRSKSSRSASPLSRPAFSPDGSAPSSTIRLSIVATLETPTPKGDYCGGACLLFMPLFLLLS
jgi:hypothetical protein